MRRALALCAFTTTLSLAGCSGVTAPDLFVVNRHGETPGAKLTLLVNEEGGVSCDGRPARQKLEDAQIIKAREIQEELLKPSAAHLSLPPRKGSTLSYRVRDESGTVSFSDNSAGQPLVLQKLQLFVLQTAQQICHRSE
jgi:hypothetical protein